MTARVAVVTGSDRGIGHAIATMLATVGFEVVGARTSGVSQSGG